MWRRLLGLDVLISRDKMGNRDGFTVSAGDRKMNKIKQQLRVSELDTLSNAIVRLYRDAVSSGEGALSGDGNLASMMADAERLALEISVAIRSDRAESTLDESDIARDGIIRDLADALTGYAAIPVPEKKAAAGRLLSIFRKYGRGITGKSYAEESSLVESMLGDFSSEPSKADISLLEGVGELLTSLRSAQDAFHRASDAFTASKAGKGESATGVRKRIVSLLNGRLVPYLSCLSSFPGYADFVSRCGAEIDRANSAVAVRGKPGQSGLKTEGAEASV